MAMCSKKSDMNFDTNYFQTLSVITLKKIRGERDICLGTRTKTELVMLAVDTAQLNLECIANNKNIRRSA